MLFAWHVDKVRETFFDSTLPVATASRTKVLVVEVIMVGMGLNLSTFEKRTISFESLDARKELLFNVRIAALRGSEFARGRQLGN